MYTVDGRQFRVKHALIPFKNGSIDLDKVAELVIRESLAVAAPATAAATLSDSPKSLPIKDVLAKAVTDASLDFTVLTLLITCSCVFS